MNKSNTYCALSHMGMSLQNESDFCCCNVNKRCWKNNQHEVMHVYSHSLKDVYKKVFINKEEITDSFQFGAGAQFIVSKESIQKHPKEFYLNIINLLNYNINPIEGFVIERFHPLIFS